MLKTLRQFAIGYAIGVALVAVFFLLVGTAHCMVSSKHTNTIGFQMFEDNPYIYKAGAVTTTAYLAGNKGIVVRIQPLSTYSLFTEDLLFCDQPVELFFGKHNPIVLTYRRQALKTIEGIGCHILVRVDEMSRKEVQ